VAGSVLAPAAPVLDPDVIVQEDRRADLPWLVVVWDDPVNLMSYVTLVLRRVLGLDRAEAERLMLKVHHEGRAVVAAEAREQAELHVAQLHAYGLRATVERDG
jgi:ATP-dependent Clp protease adaptor protein ClpS